MNTSATNRRLRVLLTAIRGETLIPQPDFQRRLVWSNKHKNAFIRTVLDGYPFPEIYIAAGDVNPETGEGTELLVDGQQRITTLHQYFVGSEQLRLPPEIPYYSELGDDEKLAFLQYQVVIRDLGKKSKDEIIEIFTRINSTNYALNAMEIHNARFDGEFKIFGECVAQDEFFERHRVFSPGEIRRMNDTRFALTMIISIMATYFNRDSELESYLRQYNDEFEHREEVSQEIQIVFQFIDACELDFQGRIRQKADLLTLLVEIHRSLIKENRELDSVQVGDRLREFYARVDRVPTGDETNREIIEYHTATAQASNDRASRLLRGDKLQKVIKGEPLQESKG